MILNNNKKRNNNGFTLLEMIIVVAVIVILGAISFVLAPNIKRRLLQKELDSKAELIFQVAQSNLTGLKASGEDSEYKDSTKYTKLTESLEDGVNFSNMAYFIAHNDDKFTQKIVPAKEIDPEIWANNWIVIYNYNSATVYGVFYSTEMSFTSSFESNMKNLAQSYQNRLAFSPAVGFFGGGNTGSIQEIDDKPKVEIYNGEELYAEITFDIPDLRASSYSVYYRYELYQPAYGTHAVHKTKSITITESGQYKEKVTLDSFKDQTTSTEIVKTNRFANLFPELVAGANTYIKVKAIINGIPSQDSDVAKFNSLFADDTVDKEEKEANRKIVLKYVRHLQNLSIQSGCYFNRVGTDKVSQESDIDFGSSSEWHETYPRITQFDPIIFENTDNDVSIYTAKVETTYYSLKNFNIKYVGDVEVNGKYVDTKTINGIEIIGLDPTKKNYGTGIFGAFWGNAITGVKVDNCKAEDGRERNTGILAGIIDGKNTASDMSYVSADSVTVTSTKGDAGAIAGRISKCKVTKINYHTVNGTSTISSTSGRTGFVAGIILGEKDGIRPEIDDVKIVNVTITSTNNYAGFVSGGVDEISSIKNINWKDASNNKNEVKITGGNSAGGLFGCVARCDTISDSKISSFKVSSTNKDAGGLIGYGFNLKVALVDCEVDKIEISAGKKAGGAIGFIDGTNDVVTDYSGVALNTVTPRIKNVKVLSTGNSTVINGKDQTGGIAGKLAKINLITSCTVDSAKIWSANSDAGGIVGLSLYCNYFAENTVKKCEIKADINGKNDDDYSSAGGILGYADNNKGLDTTPTILDTNSVIQTGIFTNNDEGGAGGIAGLIEKSVIVKNSHVYTYGTDGEKNSYQNKKFDWTYIDGYCSGGIIGRTWVETSYPQDKQIQIINSDAAYVIGSQNKAVYSGGLVGQVDNDIRIEKSYSCSYVQGKYVAGLVGNTCTTSGNPTITVKTSYAAGFLSPIGKGSNAAGIARSDGKGTITGYATYTVCNLAVPESSVSDIIYYATITGFSSDSITSFFYAYKGTEKKPAGTPMTPALLDKNAFASELNSAVPDSEKDKKYDVNVKESYPYNLDGLTRKNNEYPYPQFSTQRGDYYTFTESELPDVKENNLAYFENYEYSDGNSESDMFTKSTKFNGKDPIGLYFSEEKETISYYEKYKTNFHIYVDGYALALESKYSSGKVTMVLMDQSGATIKTKTIDVSSDMYLITTGEVNKQYRVIDIQKAFDIKDAINTYDQFYYRLKVTYNITGKTNTEYYYFNPRLAKSVIVVDEGETVTDFTGKDYYIRTPKHTYGLAQTYGYYSVATKNSTFHQEKDIDYDSDWYNWNYVRDGRPAHQLPIGINGGLGSGDIRPLVSDYEGGYHYIKGIYPYTNVGLDRFGFFGIIGDSVTGRGKSTVSNLFIVNDYGAYTINGNYCHTVGAFAGEVDLTGTVKNCAISGFNISNASNKKYKTSNSVGGFVGRNKGSIYNCEANTADIYYNRDKENINIGGFAGTNEGGIIENSICIAYIRTSNFGISNTPAGAFVSGFIGQFEGYYRVNNCYCFTAGPIWNKTLVYTSLHSGFVSGRDAISSDRNYYLYSKKIKTAKYQEYTLATTQNIIYHPFGRLDGGTRTEEITDFNGSNINSLFDNTENANKHKYGTPNTYAVPRFATYNKSANYLAATVKYTESDDSYTHFGEWPIKGNVKQTASKATLMARTTMTASAPKSTTSSPSTQSTPVTMFSAVAPMMTQSVNPMTDEAKNSEETVLSDEETELTFASVAPVTDEKSITAEEIATQSADSKLPAEDENSNEELVVAAENVEDQSDISNAIPEETSLASEETALPTVTAASPDVEMDLPNETEKSETKEENKEDLETVTPPLTAAPPVTSAMPISEDTAEITEDNVETPTVKEETAVTPAEDNKDESATAAPVEDRKEKPTTVTSVEDTEEETAETEEKQQLPSDDTETKTEEKTAAPPLTMMKMASRMTAPIFVNVTKDETGEDITDQVEVVVTSANSKVSVTDDVPLDYVDPYSEKTIQELTDPENGEFKNAKAFLVTAECPGTEELIISIKDKEETEYAESAENQESVEEIEYGELAQNQDSAKETAITSEAYVEDELIECDSVIIETEISSARHVGITETFDEADKAVNGDVVLSDVEEKTYTSANAEGTPFVLPNEDFGDDENANLLIYSVDGFGFDPAKNGYSITRIEVDRAEKTNVIKEVLGLNNEEETSRIKTFVIYDKDITKEGTLDSYNWDYSEYYCRIGKPVEVEENSRKIDYLPIILTGRQKDAVTFRITLQHNNEKVILSYDLKSVQNEFEVIHKDGNSVIRRLKVGFGSIVYHPDAKDFAGARSDTTGYIYPEMSTLSNASNWTPSIPNMIYEDMTFMLNRTPITYTVILDPNGGTGNTTPLTCKYDEWVEVDFNSFSNGNLELLGWAYEPQGDVLFDYYILNAASENGSTVTLYAIWGEEKEAVEYPEEELMDEDEPEKADETTPETIEETAPKVAEESKNETAEKSEIKPATESVAEATDKQSTQVIEETSEKTASDPATESIPETVVESVPEAAVESTTQVVEEIAEEQAVNSSIIVNETEPQPATGDQG